jgi:hypothetical protein
MHGGVKRSIGSRWWRRKRGDRLQLTPVVRWLSSLDMAQRSGGRMEALIDGAGDTGLLVLVVVEVSKWPNSGGRTKTFCRFVVCGGGNALGFNSLLWSAVPRDHC